MSKKSLLALYSVSLLLFYTKTFCQNPLSAAQGFNLFTEGNFTITQGDIEGAIGVGGNLIVLGNSQRTSANATGGVAHVSLGGVNYALVVGGGLSGTNGGKIFKVDPKSGTTNHYVRFNSISPSTAVGSSGGIDIGNPPTDPNKRYLRINSTSQAASSVVNATSLVDFASAFTTLRSQSSSMAGCSNNVTATVSGGQASINLGANSTNVWNISGSTLNSYSQINVSGNLPSASRPLIINVSGTGTFNWLNVKLVMGSESDNFMEINRAPYIIWNFKDVTTLNIQNSNLILGSVLAPNAALTINGSGNITGQVIVKSLSKPQAGELHIATFAGNVTCGATSSNCDCPNNLIVNPGFENGTTGWYSWSGNFNATTNYVKCGSKRGEFQSTAQWGGFGQDISGITPGSKLNLKFFGGVHNSSDNTYVKFEFYNGSSYISDTLIAQVDGSAENMQLYQGSAVVPPQTTIVKVIGGMSAGWLKTDGWCLTTEACTQTAGVSKNRDIDCINTNATLTATPSTGVTYAWSGGGASVTKTVTSAGTYTVTVTNTTTGCWNTATVQVNSNTTKPTVSLSKSNDLSCTTNSATLTASPSSGATYAWSAGATPVSGTNKATVTAAGTYTVTVTSAANGCSNTATVQVTGSNICCTCPGNLLKNHSFDTLSSGVPTKWLRESPATNFQGNSDYEVCGQYNGAAYYGTNTSTFGRVYQEVNVENNQGGAFTLSGYGAVHNNTYNAVLRIVFYNASNSKIDSFSSSQIDGIAPLMTLYTVTGNVPLSAKFASIEYRANADWVKMDQVCFTVNCVKPIVTTHPAPLTICNGDPFGTMTVVTSGNNLSYQWEWSTNNTSWQNAGNPGNNTSILTVDNYTNLVYYRVKITAPGGCVSFSNSALYTVKNKPTAGINGTQTICSGDSSTFTASGGGTYLWSTGATTASIKVKTAGTYTVTVTKDGCTATATRTLTVTPLPTAGITGTQTICAGDSSTFTASGGGTYLWSTGATTASIKVKTAGTYTVTVTKDGCTATATRTLTVTPLPTAGITGTQTICAGDSSTFTASGGGTYLWSTGATTASIKVKTAGTYTVTVTKDGCTATATRTLTLTPLPTAGITGNQPICAGDSSTLTASGGGSYLWSTGATTASIKVKSAGTYSVTVTDNGCKSVTSINVVQPNESFIGDYVWLDNDNNGIQSFGDLPLSNVTVELFNDANTDGNPDGVALTQTTTNNNGYYSFKVCPGSYLVKFTNPDGNQFTFVNQNVGNDITVDSDANKNTGFSGTVTITTAQSNMTIDAGFLRYASLGDKVWLDANANGIQDDSELGIGNVRVRLFNNAGVQIDSTLTNSIGIYGFNKLLPGTYSVGFAKPNGFVFTSRDTTTANDETDSDADKITGKTGTYVLGPGDNNITVDAGLYQLSSLGDYVWFDLNKNGIQDDRMNTVGQNMGPELPVKGAIIELYKSDNTLIKKDTTDENGFYKFENLIPGQYYIKFDTNSYPGDRYVVTMPNQGSNNSKDSDIQRGTYRSVLINLLSGQHDPTWDLGIFRNRGAILDPCTCKNNASNERNGQFDEYLEVKATPGGEWRIIAQTGMYLLSSPLPPAAPILVPLGTILPPESPGLYVYDFIHVDSMGYSVTVTDGFDTLSISNFCTYPELNFDTIDLAPVCIFDTAIPLSSLPNMAGDVDYFIVNTMSNDTSLLVGNVLNPSLLGVGSFKVIAEFVPFNPMECKNRFVQDVNIAVNGCTSAIGDRVWSDLNANGIQDSGEPGIASVTVTLLNGSGTPVTTNAYGDPIAPRVTDVNGNYKFDSLVPGTYIVEFGIVTGRVRTTSNVVTPLDSLDSDADVTSGRTGVYTLVNGEYNKTVDAGYVCVNIFEQDTKEICVDETFNLTTVQPINYPGGIWYDNLNNLVTNPTAVQIGDYEYRVNTISCGMVRFKQKLIENLPDYTSIITLIPNSINGASTVNVLVDILELNEKRACGPIIARLIPLGNRFTFTYDQNATAIGGMSVNNREWEYLGVIGGYYTWRYIGPNAVMGSLVPFPAGGYSNFGFSGVYNPFGTNGVTSFSVNVFPLNGAESSVMNNSSTDLLNYRRK